MAREAIEAVVLVVSQTPTPARGNGEMELNEIGEGLTRRSVD